MSEQKASRSTIDFMFVASRQVGVFDTLHANIVTQNRKAPGTHIWWPSGDISFTHPDIVYSLYAFNYGVVERPLEDPIRRCVSLRSFTATTTLFDSQNGS